jgi:hypothetical protein
VALIVTRVEVLTPLVVTLKVTLLTPAGTVTLDGSDATVLLLERFTTIPLLGASAVKVTKPVDPWPAVTAAGLRLTDFNAAGEFVCFAHNPKKLKVDTATTPTVAILFRTMAPLLLFMISSGATAR